MSVMWCYTVIFMVTVVIKTSSSTAVRTDRTLRDAYRSECSRTCCHATHRTCSASRTVDFTSRRARREPAASSSGTWASRTATRWRLVPVFSSRCFYLP